MYNDRARLLYELAHRDECLSKIVIIDTLEQFFGKLMSQHASFTKTVTCKICNASTIYADRIIKMNIDVQSIAILEQLVTQFISEYIACNNTCALCKKAGVPQKIEFCNYLGISIEQGGLLDFVTNVATYVSLYIRVVLIYWWVSLHMSRMIIQFIYTAYCRKPVSTWDMRNGTQGKIINCENVRRENIVFLVYLKIN